MHVYVNTNEGLTYTAISPLPERISYSLQLLSPIGEVIAWMFAVPSGKGINGFTHTGWYGPHIFGIRGCAALAGHFFAKNP